MTQQELANAGHASQQMISLFLFVEELISENEMKILLTTHIFRCIIFNNKRQLHTTLSRVTEGLGPMTSGNLTCE